MRSMPSRRRHRVTARRSSRRFRAAAQAACGSGRRSGLATQRFGATRRGPPRRAPEPAQHAAQVAAAAERGVRIADRLEPEHAPVRASTRITCVLLVGSSSQSLAKQTMPLAGHAAPHGGARGSAWVAAALRSQVMSVDLGAQRRRVPRRSASDVRDGRGKRRRVAGRDQPAGRPT